MNKIKCKVQFQRDSSGIVTVIHNEDAASLMDKNKIRRCHIHFMNGEKVIASTSDKYENKIPQSFIDVFLSMKGRISEVFVTLDETNKPKIRKDKTVIVSTVNNTFTTSEVISLLNECWDTAINSDNKTDEAKKQFLTIKGF